ncbi:hypothetical protein AsAng_0012170 [Aureispira anguillae]|uniref:Uncharacterized protein n=1 Tax=Aureispira anguillae TaxID=2864201 RepID=A0A916DPG2_9BACT|nr:hypothetical protein AsAng_0012170 [Aureispira anguillae]
MVINRIQDVFLLFYKKSKKLSHECNELINEVLTKKINA